MFHTHKIVFGKLKKFIPTVRSLGCQDILFSLASLARFWLNLALWSSLYGGVPFGSTNCLLSTSFWIGVASKW
ncbi:hypothetical protein DPMN_168360 [Dreissena polymorpha]|uniref:Uncharacterized protein n=1 Tax=Dreissena polymorpha TaxID=45954 RepID=A0A9D4F0H8_DREPO|nr:hypothetical protein DPMN_168360 [Dreissena polymorpha]